MVGDGRHRDGGLHVEIENKERVSVIDEVISARSSGYRINEGGQSKSCGRSLVLDREAGDKRLRLHFWRSLNLTAAGME